MSKQPLPAPTVSAVGPCPTVIQIVGRTGTGSLPSTIAPPDHPPSAWEDVEFDIGLIQFDPRTFKSVNIGTRSVITLIFLKS